MQNLGCYLSYLTQMYFYCRSRLSWNALLLRIAQIAYNMEIHNNMQMGEQEQKYDLRVV